MAHFSWLRPSLREQKSTGYLLRSSDRKRKRRRYSAGEQRSSLRRHLLLNGRRGLEKHPGFTAEINYWIFEAALNLLADRPDIGLIYVHTTDYPMHMWPPEATESKEHLAKIDTLLQRISQVAPDAAVLLTADHSMNFKKRCWDLDKALEAQGAPIQISISAERDKYVKHHRGMGGAAWVYLKQAGDLNKVRAILSGLEGVEAVLTRAEAVETYNLMASRIGDLVVLGDKDTVF